MMLSTMLLPAVLVATTVATTVAPAPVTEADDLGAEGMWVPASQVQIDGVPSSEMTGMIWVTPGTPAVPGNCDEVSPA